MSTASERGCADGTVLNLAFWTDYSLSSNSTRPTVENMQDLAKQVEKEAGIDSGTLTATVAQFANQAETRGRRSTFSCDASGNTPLAGDFLQITFTVLYPKQCGNLITSNCATRFLNNITIVIRSLTVLKASIQLTQSASVELQLMICSVTSQTITMKCNASINCNATGGSGNCVPTTTQTNAYTCTACAYGINTTNGPCPANPCNSVNCSSNSGGGTCTALSDGTVNYKCTSCMYGADVSNGPCPASPCTTNPCTANRGGGTCNATGGGTAGYGCSACLYSPGTTNVPCSATPCTSVNCNSNSGGGICTALSDGTVNYKCTGCINGVDVSNGPCPGN
ncbi:unnamed protein product [Adineta steineri]|uniref:Uncharacterized protein n=1 Tax=Adineta steineri TaxID=433720 RepID=A0A819USH9_9BILA|nr:unnamed protein product [Adineta steineri]